MEAKAPGTPVPYFRRRHFVAAVLLLLLAFVGFTLWRKQTPEAGRAPQLNPEAQRYHVDATKLLSGNTADLRKAVELFEGAVRVDPNYALAWAGLAHAWTLLANFGEARPADALPRAAEAAQRAIALDENLSESQQAAARVKVFYERDWAGAEKAIRRAVELDPGNINARYDYARLVLTPTGRFADAEEQLKSAIAIDPRNNALRNELANVYIKSRRFGEAVPYLESAREIAPDAPASLVMLGMVACGKGDYEQALEHFEEASRYSRSGWVLGHLGYALVKLGRHQEAAHVVSELERVPAGKEPPDYDVAVIHAALGEKDLALAELERAADSLSTSILWAKVDYRLDDLQRHSRFHILLRKIGLQ